MLAPYAPSPGRTQDGWSLRHGSLVLITVMRDKSSPLWRVIWPDIGPSPPANLTRCMDAAQQWAEQKYLTEHRKNGAARCLKSLNNFSWSRSLMRWPEKDDLVVAV